MPPEDWSSEYIMTANDENKGNAELTAGTAGVIGVFDDIVKGVSKHATQW